MFVDKNPYSSVNTHCFFPLRAGNLEKDKNLRATRAAMKPKSAQPTDLCSLWAGAGPWQALQQTLSMSGLKSVTLP